ncbi:MAG: hypothetical protein HYY43_00910 [Deltaproteobacteria bacterium]|nr:hypothetical protein [Deltaproteobacteria bacterium]MBI2341600.1 hypothetical protein [Deltaproteobacteria bacterium]MBI2974141.1 hypothetical protein [Deltaproteobacteria bacterium]
MADIKEFESNRLVRYLLEFYDDKTQAGSGTTDFVDPVEKEGFCREEIGGQYCNAQIPVENFNKWKQEAVARAPYLSDVTVDDFRKVMAQYPLRPPKYENKHIDTIHVGDIYVSTAFNKETTVAYAKKKGDIPREDRTFMPLDPKLPVSFTIELVSVNAYYNEGAEKSNMTAPSTIYVVPESYNGPIPPSSADAASGSFAEIIPGKTKAEITEFSENEGGRFAYRLEMPASSYRIHAVSGQFPRENNEIDFDNFDVNVAGSNTLINPEYGKSNSLVAIVGADVGNVTTMCSLDGGKKGLCPIKGALPHTADTGLLGSQLSAIAYSKYHVALDHLNNGKAIDLCVGRGVNENCAVEAGYQNGTRFIPVKKGSNSVFTVLISGLEDKGTMTVQNGSERTDITYSNENIIYWKKGEIIKSTIFDRAVRPDAIYTEAEHSITSAFSGKKSRLVEETWYLGAEGVLIVSYNKGGGSTQRKLIAENAGGLWFVSSWLYMGEKKPYKFEWRRPKADKFDAEREIAAYRRDYTIRKVELPLVPQSDAIRVDFESKVTPRLQMDEVRYDFSVEEINK